MTSQVTSQVSRESWWAHVRLSALAAAVAAQARPQSWLAGPQTRGARRDESMNVVVLLRIIQFNKVASHRSASAKEGRCQRRCRQSAFRRRGMEAGSWARLAGLRVAVRPPASCERTRGPLALLRDSSDHSSLRSGLDSIARKGDGSREHVGVRTYELRHAHVIRRPCAQSNRDLT